MQGITSTLFPTPVETYVSCRAEADSEPTALNYFSADHNNSLSNGLLDHSDSPAFSRAMEDVDSMAHRFRGEPMPLTHVGYSGPSPSCRYSPC